MRRKRPKRRQFGANKRAKTEENGENAPEEHSNEEEEEESEEEVERGKVILDKEKLSQILEEMANKSEGSSVEELERILAELMR